MIAKISFLLMCSLVSVYASQNIPCLNKRSVPSQKKITTRFISKKLAAELYENLDCLQASATQLQKDIYCALHIKHAMLYDNSSIVMTSAEQEAINNLPKMINSYQEWVERYYIDVQSLIENPTIIITDLHEKKKGYLKARDLLVIHKATIKTFWDILLELEIKITTI